MIILLTREEFRKSVFDRDHCCVACSKITSLNAHHIIDRVLWPDGGYYLDNGACLCEECHLLAEKTLLSCDEIRNLAHIQKVHYPEHFFEDEVYDKWGNIILPSGMRVKGELYGEANLRKILPEAVLNSFLTHVKYPRTYHVPWSENLKNDDRRHSDMLFFFDKEIVGTIKLDGESCSIYSDYIHARSLDSKHHESRAWVKALQGRISHEIPDGWRICGENMFAKHSIHYNNLETYFYVISIWNQNNIALSWDDTIDYAGILGLSTVPVFFRGVWEHTTPADLETAYKKYQEASPDPVEGYVIRTTNMVTYKDFRRSYAKWVRKGHVQSSQFWMHEKIVPNRLKHKES